MWSVSPSRGNEKPGNTSGLGVIESPALSHARIESKARWLPYLTIIIFAQIAVLLYLVPRDYQLLNRVEDWNLRYIRGPRIARQRAALMKKDLPLGTRVIALSQVNLWEALQHQGIGAVSPGKADVEPTTVAVFVAGCTPCAAAEFHKWAAFARERPSLHVVIISRDTPTHIAQFVRDEKFSLPILSDGGGAIAHTVNAFYVPRTYQVNADGTLIWIQKEEGMSVKDIVGAVASPRPQSASAVDARTARGADMP